jgi:hypothetical protein
VTYPDARVQAAIAERFVPLRLDLFNDRAVVRPLNVIWTPTLLVADRRGVIHYRNVNYLPADDFLDMLDIGEANTRLRWAEYDHAIELLAAVTNRQPDGVFAAEAIYWRGIATYLKTHSNEEMYRLWQEILQRFSETVWARRVP